MSGTLFIVTAPSGAGKTSLVRALLSADDAVKVSVSFTTRPPRQGERDGVDYHFVSRPDFEAMRARGEFLESAEVHSNLYGTSRLWIEGQMAAGADILLEIDWQGALQVKQLVPMAVGVFVLPPSLEVLAARLAGRATDSAEVIARRLGAARAEISHVGAFDYVIINDDFDVALHDLRAVVRAERLKLGPQKARHPALFASLS